MKLYIVSVAYMMGWELEGIKTVGVRLNASLARGLADEYDNNINRIRKSVSPFGLTDEKEGYGHKGYSNLSAKDREIFNKWEAEFNDAKGQDPCIIKEFDIDADDLALFLINNNFKKDINTCTHKESDVGLRIGPGPQ